MRIGSQEALYRGFASQPPPNYVQYKPQIITTAKEEEGGPRVGPEVGRAEERVRDKISHIYSFYISINLAPAGWVCVED